METDRPATETTGRQRLTEIEAYALGLVESYGEATAYRVRQAFASSPSAQGRGSAGSIYPVLRRLESRGLVRERSHATGRRRSRLISITPEGRRSLREWLAPPLAEELGLPLDPLRARVRFLGALTAEERLRFLDEARNLLEGVLDQLEQRLLEHQKGGSAWEIAMARGAVMVTRARLAWIEELSQTLESTP